MRNPPSRSDLLHPPYQSVRNPGYLLRSNVTDWSDEDLWWASIQLTEAEAAFRIHKSGLSLRPIWHQKQERVLAHILVCFLAYVPWKTLASLCRQAGLGDESRRVLDELAAIRAMDVVLPTREGVEIRRRVSKPSDHQAILLPPRPQPAVPIKANRLGVRKFTPRSLHSNHLRRSLGKLGYAADPHWRDLRLFHEYFHGDTGRASAPAIKPDGQHSSRRSSATFTRNRKALQKQN